MHKGQPLLFSICEVNPHLFVSGYNAVEEKKLRQIGITHCVDCVNLPKSLRISAIEYHVITGVADTLTSNLKQHFQATADFVRKAQQSGGKALVYCGAGVSRAATLCIMCLVINERISLKEAYQQVLKVRPIIAPNLGFWRQMIEWECEQSADGKSSTVHLLKGMRQLVPDVYLHRSEVVGDSLPFQERSRRAVGRPFDTPGGGGGFLASPVQHES